jgi:hydroxymethylpyrimidine/phosphomethylpyrimidine kinase
MKKILTIAGSDCSGGAGIQADIKTITAHKMYAMSVVTALTAQNTCGVSDILEVPPEFVGKQMDMIFTDIIPDAVKIGMLANRQIAEVIYQKLTLYRAKNIVIDPVMISTSGRQLLDNAAVNLLITGLMPLAAFITPNLAEAEKLCGFPIKDKSDMLRAAAVIAKSFSGDILIKGGHLKESCDDLLYTQGEFVWFEHEKIENPNTHGTGCTLSSAIACSLAEDMDIRSCVAAAKDYITGAIQANLNIGKGNGPLNHCWNL